MQAHTWTFDDFGTPRFLVIARVLLLLAIAVSALYQLQHYLSFPFGATGRFALFVGVSALVLFSRPRLILSIPALFWCLGLTVAWTGFHTHLLFGPQLALEGTTRFANVMIIAPLASILFDRRHIRIVFAVYVVVFAAALLSMLYQYAGGSMETLVGSYIAIRADLVRYMTVVGEPNVGGMIAVLAFVIGVSIPRKTIVSVALAGLSLVLAVITISKSATLGVGLVCVLLLLAAPGEKRSRILVRMILAGVVGLLLLFLIGADDYLVASVRSVLGLIPGEPSALGDFVNRQAGLGHDLDAVVRMLFGSSFGIAGSAAQEVLGADADVILPHNSYMEMYLTGGLVMVGVTILLMAFATRRIILDARKYGRPEEHCALVCLIILSCWMLVYPVIYEPATGALFWVIIAYGNRPVRSHA